MGIIQRKNLIPLLPDAEAYRRDLKKEVSQILNIS